MSAIQGLLKYCSEWKDSQDFQNCPGVRFLGVARLAGLHCSKCNNSRRTRYTPKLNFLCTKRIKVVIPMILHKWWPFLNALSTNTMNQTAILIGSAASYTYPIAIFDADVNLICQVFQNVLMSSFSCTVQRAPLLNKGKGNMLG